MCSATDGQMLLIERVEPLAAFLPDIVTRPCVFQELEMMADGRLFGRARQGLIHDMSLTFKPHAAQKLHNLLTGIIRQRLGKQNRVNLHTLIISTIVDMSRVFHPCSQIFVKIRAQARRSRRALTVHDWEYTTLYLSAKALVERMKCWINAELAKRLAEAIIRKSHRAKAEGWEPLEMDFHDGEVTLKFRRLQTAAINPTSET